MRLKAGPVLQCPNADCKHKQPMLAPVEALAQANGGIRHMQLTIRLLRETDGRWIADIPELPGVTVYGVSPDEATLKAKALALRVVAEKIEHGEMPPGPGTPRFSIAA